MSLSSGNFKLLNNISKMYNTKVYFKCEVIMTFALKLCLILIVIVNLVVWVCTSLCFSTLKYLNVCVCVCVYMWCCVLLWHIRVHKLLN